MASCMASDAKFAVYMYFSPSFLYLLLFFIDALLSLILAVALVRARCQDVWFGGRMPAVDDGLKTYAQES